MKIFARTTWSVFETIRTRHLTFLVLMIAVAGCDTVEEATGVEGNASLSAIQGKVLRFVPDVPIGGIARSELQFLSGFVVACNEEARYETLGWELLDDTTVRVHYEQSQWENYTVVNTSGSLQNSDFRGRYLYDSSPGIQMEGSFTQVSALTLCP